MFSTLTKREKEGNTTKNDSSSLFEHRKKKKISNESACFPNFRKEPQKDIINIENLLRFSRKFQKLNTMPTE